MTTLQLKPKKTYNYSKPKIEKECYWCKEYFLGTERRFFCCNDCGDKFHAIRSKIFRHYPQTESDVEIEALIVKGKNYNLGDGKNGDY